jgi:hypothetical protein
MSALTSYPDATGTTRYDEYGYTPSRCIRTDTSSSQRCVCFGVSDHRYQGGNKQRFGVLSPTQVKEMEKVVDDYKAALINNYDCNGGEPTVPTQKDFDYDNPIAYPKCFIAFPRKKDSDTFYCTITKENW